MKKWIIALALLMQIGVATAIEISVGQGSVAEKPIAVVPFAGNSEAHRIDYIVSTDLRQSGVFSPISPDSYKARPSSAKQINYSAFKNAGAAYVVVGKKTGNRIEFAIADSYQQTVIADYSVDLAGRSLRQAAHQVSDLILQKLTGTRGAFSSRLAYIHETGQGSSRRYRLMVSDSDGSKPIQLLNSKAPIMSPRFSPDGNTLAYVTFEGQRAQIVTHDIRSGRRALVSKAPGMNASPAWSPDGKKIAMVLSKDGNAEVYFKNLSSGRLVRVTNNPAIDTEPVWSPSGNEIYFTSSRSGAPQLYRININSGSVSRVTHSGSYSAGADISDDGNLIALARKQGERFIVGTIDRRTNRFRGVSQGVVDETPRFSPNGKMLIFTSVQGDRTVLKVVNVDGSGTNTLSAKGHVRDADWSTYLQ